MPQQLSTLSSYERIDAQRREIQITSLIIPCPGSSGTSHPQLVSDPLWSVRKHIASSDRTVDDLDVVCRSLNTGYTS